MALDAPVWRYKSPVLLIMLELVPSWYMSKSELSPKTAFALSLKIKDLADASHVTEVIPAASPSNCKSTPDLKVAIPAVIWIPPVVALNPAPAVTIPTESTLVTSSWVIVPATDTVVNVAAVPVILPLKWVALTVPPVAAWSSAIWSPTLALVVAVKIPVTTAPVLVVSILLLPL